MYAIVHCPRISKNHRNIVTPDALLPNKRRATYVETLTEVQQLTYNAMPHSLMTEFESIMLSALNQIYPGIPQVGYLFHLAKNVFRRVQDIGLQQNYLTNPLFRGNIRMISALSFVLVQDVILALNELCNHCGIDEQPVHNYLFIHCFRLSCKKKSHYGLTSWNFSQGVPSPPYF